MRAKSGNVILAVVQEVHTILQPSQPFVIVLQVQDNKVKINVNASKLIVNVIIGITRLRYVIQFGKMSF